MFDVSKFLSGLGASGLKRKDFMAEIQRLGDELNQEVIPAYYALATRQKLMKWESSFCKTVERETLSGCRKDIRSERNFASVVHANLQLVSGLLTHIGKRIEERMADRALSDELPMEVVSLFSAVNNITYLARFSMSLLNVMLGEEAVARKAVDGVEPHPPAITDRAKTGYQAFIRTLASLAVPTPEFDDKIRSLEALRFNKKTWATIKYNTEVTKGMVDTPVSDFYWSPIFMVRKVIADWQTKRYEDVKAKRVEIEMLIQLLEEKQASGNDNPQIQKELNYCRQRVAKMDREISRVEAEINED